MLRNSKPCGSESKMQDATTSRTSFPVFIQETNKDAFVPFRSTWDMKNCFLFLEADDRQGLLSHKR